MALDEPVWLTFVTILLMTFALVLLIAGAFTAYFGSGKSRKIGAGLLVGGIAVGVIWVFLTAFGGPLDQGAGYLSGVVVQAIIVLLAALVGAAGAIGLFLLAIMKS